MKYAQTKCMLALAKSLLSQKVKQVVQEKMAEEIAAMAQLESKHQVLSRIISFALLQIDFLKAGGTSGTNCHTFEQTLKFLVYLTITKPYVEKEARCMHIKSQFIVDFDTLLQLKDYLK